MLVGFLSGGCDRRSQVDKQSKQARANHEVLPGLRQQAGRRHRLPPWKLTDGYQCKLMAAELRFGEAQMNSRRKEIHTGPDELNLEILSYGPNRGWNQVKLNLG